MHRYLLTPAIWGREKAYLSEKWGCKCILFIITQKEGCWRYDLFSQFFRSRFKSHSHVQKIFYFVYSSQDIPSFSICGLPFQHVSLAFCSSLKASVTSAFNLTPGCILSLSVSVLQAVAHGYIKDGSSWYQMPVIIKPVITYHANTNNIKENLNNWKCYLRGKHRSRSQNKGHNQESPR